MNFGFFSPLNFIIKFHALISDFNGLIQHLIEIIPREGLHMDRIKGVSWTRKESIKTVL
jgi:hypothetical protein